EWSADCMSILWAHWIPKRNGCQIGIKSYREPRLLTWIWDSTCDLKSSCGEIPPNGKSWRSAATTTSLQSGTSIKRPGRIRRIESYPRESRAYSWLGNVFLCQGQYEKAAEVTRQFLRLAPNDVSWYENLVFSALALQRFDQARQMARKADDVS